ncbi:MAG: hypothetical protein MZV64_41140 [Ignavibacteriales bacterium]|nr:hypothetical protein [Ignavibacteriales bacterium]
MIRTLTLCNLHRLHGIKHDDTGNFAGMIQEALGYPNFFVWMLLTMIPGFFITKMLKIDADFGKKKVEAK